MQEKDKICLNIGCGGRPLPNYINIDMDTIETIRKRYPGRNFSDDLVVKQFDIFNLPFADLSVDEIISEALIEHLSFSEEPLFFREMARVLKPGGLITISTVDFEKTVSQWLEAQDDWKEFYRSDDEAINQKHWFGTYTYEPKNRWGYLVATIFGSQNGEGQYHKNCYTEKKLMAICQSLNFNIIKVEKFQWQGDRDHMIRIYAKKDVN